MKIEKEFVFPAESRGQCHASTLVEMGDGTIMSAWFAGTRESARDVSIEYARRTGDGWSEPLRIQRALDQAHWNPVLFRAKDDLIHLFYKIGISPYDWQTWYTTSRDGKMWSDPKELVPGDRNGRGPVKNKPIQLHNGNWLAPGSLEYDRTWEAFVDISKDNGRTWEMFKVPMDSSDFKAEKARGVIQPSVWESKPGHVHMLLRSTEGFIFRSDSSDGGKTWSTVKPTTMPNNNSGLDVAMRSDGLLALVCNPVKGNWVARTPLTLFLSEDNGQTWKKALDFETEEGEFSYPSAIFSSSGELLATYTWKRKTVAFCRVFL